jgi:hypothetical protein
MKVDHRSDYFATFQRSLMQPRGAAEEDAPLAPDALTPEGTFSRGGTTA